MPTLSRKAQFISSFRYKGRTVQKHTVVPDDDQLQEAFLVAKRKYDEMAAEPDAAVAAQKRVPRKKRKIAE